jgi:SEC-C motif-containing protein
MRSRYAAFVKRDAGYLVRTSHPLLRARFDANSLRASFALAWVRLDIMAIRDGGVGDRRGMVHFRATWKDAAGAEQYHEERSRFVRDGGVWVYRDAGG